MFVAIQVSIPRIVFGIGETRVAALEDAKKYTESMEEVRSYLCSEALAEAVLDGRIRCEIDGGCAYTPAEIASGELGR